MADLRTAPSETGSVPGPATPGNHSSSDSSIGSLISKATTDLSKLMRQEVELAKLELKVEVEKARKSAGLLGGAGGTAYFAVLFVSLSVMFALGELMPLGWAALILGALYGITALVLLSKGRTQLKTIDPTPHQTVETLKEDVQWAKHPTR